MLFNSYAFIFAFLPVVFIVYRALCKQQKRTALAWLTLSSLFFYCWWNPPFIMLLLGSILSNYYLAQWIDRTHGYRTSKYILLAGIAGNLGLIGYYKYANFFLDCINPIFNTNWNLGHIFLPIGISFFTFQQVAYLVDRYQDPQTNRCSLMDYMLFVSFFPQLIAGPIVHHKEILGQFAAHTDDPLQTRHDIANGLSQFSIGLFKKVMIADNLALIANPLFLQADGGRALCMADSWIAALAYTFQLYFDFSGYSDMAIGLGKMFGIQLPVNFNSPYKAQNIADFWRRWHITLSTFLRDYVYIPLGGNRKGDSRRYVNLMLTMLIGGLWHGAGKTFIVWGGLHGIFLCLHQLWSHFFCTKTRNHSSNTTMNSRFAATALTFIAVTLAWVVFRASTFGGAARIYMGMAGLNGITKGMRSDLSTALPMLLVGMLVVWGLPNTQQIHLNNSGNWSLRRIAMIRWHASWRWSLMTGSAFALSCLMLNRVSDFLYWQF